MSAFITPSALSASSFAPGSLRRRALTCARRGRAATVSHGARALLADGAGVSGSGGQLDTPSDQVSPGISAGFTAVKRLGVLVSGGGRTVENLLEEISSGRLTGCEVSVVVISRQSGGALSRIAPYSSNYAVLERSGYESAAEFDVDVERVLVAHEVDMVVLAGWIHLFRIPQQYTGRVLNIHPSLLPAFGGRGFYGRRVHEAALRAGVKVSGCTVHVANEEYDRGRILVQRVVDVDDTDTPDTLAAKVFEQEKIALPQAIQQFIKET